jgi:hypothetical protein
MKTLASRLLVLIPAASAASAWFCIPMNETVLRAGVVWKTQNCTASLDKSPPLLVVNSLTVDLTRSDVRLVPAVAKPLPAAVATKLAKPNDDDDGGGDTGDAVLNTLPEMAAQDAKFIAGVNGGYFWRVDVSGIWRDNVCRGKLRSDAEKQATPDHVNYGVGDGVVIIDGEAWCGG